MVGLVGSMWCQLEGPHIFRYQEHWEGKKREQRRSFHVANFLMRPGKKKGKGKAGKEVVQCNESDTHEKELPHDAVSHEK